MSFFGLHTRAHTRTHVHMCKCVLLAHNQGSPPSYCVIRRAAAHSFMNCKVAAGLQKAENGSDNEEEKESHD